MLGRADGVGPPIVGFTAWDVLAGGGVTSTRAIGGAGGTGIVAIGMMGMTGVGAGAGVTRTSAVSRASSTAHSAEMASDSATSARGSTLGGGSADTTGGVPVRSLTVGVVLIGADAIGALACDSTGGAEAGDFTLRAARLRGLGDSFAGGVGAPAFARGFAFGVPGPFGPSARGVFDFLRPMHRSRCPSSVHRTVSDAQ